MPRVHPDVLRSGDFAAIQAAESLIKALSVSDWGTKNFQAGKMTRRTLLVHSKKLALLAVFNTSGRRVSVYDYPMDYEGDLWCQIQQLII